MGIYWNISGTCRFARAITSSACEQGLSACKQSLVTISWRPLHHAQVLPPESLPAT